MREVDLVVRGTLINVLTGNIEDRSIAIDDGVIIGFGDRSSRRTIDCNFITPGLINSHTHLEVSMLTVPNYGQAVIPSGVTSVVTDPHEIANVLGAAGIKQMLADANSTPLKAFFVIPSSVPASSLQDAGSSISAEDVHSLLDLDFVVGLGEVMDIAALVDGDEDLHAMIEAARNRGLTVDGHLPRITGERLLAAARYLDNDHESVSLDEGREKLDAGLRLHIREGSSSKNLDALRPLVDDVDSRRLMLCTDNFYIEDLINHGGIDRIVSHLISDGVDPVEAVQMATLNPAEEYDIPFGAPKPGSPADLVLLDDLETWAVQHVLINGVVDPVENKTSSVPTQVDQNTVIFESVTASSFTLVSPNPGPHEVRVIDNSGRSANRMVGTVEGVDGELQPNLEADILPVSVVERHGKGAGIGNGFVHGIGLQHGALGSTVSHDAHNLVVAGSSFESMATVANYLRETQGGIAVYDERTEIMTALPLPIAGLMSDQSPTKVAAGFADVREAAEAIGLCHPKGLMALDTLPLEVIPEFRLTNQGLVDVDRMELVGVLI